ncbi:hypothetical protein C9374_004380 [Naegleria lovaniensis]|uniref:C2 domain-containing protein n=1 Tax=Naegleria lovaniensis TaxID=51637 RepID=A0AA88GR84_NAELO|nr:uncharacterized protein C9374_004380 [Naegleria lovaniensis]KAG2383709.1 hypothetical protein C9374_004380 [Naegleria lovaniensis]
MPLPPHQDLVQQQQQSSTLSLEIVVERATKLIAADIITNSSDPYVVVKVPHQGQTKEERTSIIKRNLNPEWNEKLEFFGLKMQERLVVTFEVYDWDRLKKDDFIGSVDMLIPMRRIQTDKEYLLQLDLNHVKSGTLHVKYKLAKRTEQPSSSVCDEDASGGSTIESFSPRSRKEFKKVYEFPSHTFVPVVPREFELCSRNIGNKAFSAVFSDSVVSLAITYKDISSLDFVESSMSSVEQYLKSLRPTCEQNGGSLQLVTENADKTYLFESGKFTKVLETSLIKKNSFGDAELCITIYACCVGYTVMAIFTQIAPSFLQPQQQLQTLIDIVNRTIVKKF